MNKIVLQKIGSTKFLGVILDENLTFEDHLIA